MNRFIRFWNGNRKKIIITILILVFAILFIQIIDNLLKQNNIRPAITANTTQIEDSSKPSESVISGQVLAEEITEKNIDIIKQFVDFCNNGDYQGAYNLISDECKDELFNTAEDFKANYMDLVFTNKKTYELELWFSNSGNYTYRIIYYYDNILSSGQVNSSEPNIEDFITVTNDDASNTKININNFIDKETINKSQENSGVNIIINERKLYRSYETYTITIENRTDKTILISEGTNSNDICLVDINETEYNSLINEIPDVNLQLTPYSRKTITIRFNKMYDEYRTIEGVLFKNIILDKDAFEQNAENVETISLGVAL